LFTWPLQQTHERPERNQLVPTARHGRTSRPGTRKKEAHFHEHHLSYVVLVIDDGDVLVDYVAAAVLLVSDDDADAVFDVVVVLVLCLKIKEKFSNI